MTAAERRRVARSVAAAVAAVDELWSGIALAGIVERCTLLGTPAVLRELLLVQLADELELEAETFEHLVEALRMSS